MTTDQVPDELTADNILALVRHFDHVSFAELVRHFPDAAGEYAMALPGHDSILLYSGISMRLGELLNDLLTQHRLRAVPASPLVYLIDGGFLSLPIAKRVRHYKKPRWLPITFRAEAA